VKENVLRIRVRNKWGHPLPHYIFRLPTAYY